MLVIYALFSNWIILRPDFDEQCIWPIFGNDRLVKIYNITTVVGHGVPKTATPAQNSHWNIKYINIRLPCTTRCSAKVGHCMSCTDACLEENHGRLLSRENNAAMQLHTAVPRTVPLLMSQLAACMPRRDSTSMAKASLSTGLRSQ